MLTGKRILNGYGNVLIVEVKKHLDLEKVKDGVLIMQEIVINPTKIKEYTGISRCKKCNKIVHAYKSRMRLLCASCDE